MDISNLIANLSPILQLLIVSLILFSPLIIIIIVICMCVKWSNKNNIAHQQSNNTENSKQPNENETKQLEMPSIEFNDILDDYNEETTQEIEEAIKIEKFCPYERKLLLTKNEWAFYKKLKIIADKHNLHILSKVRMEDLIQVKNGLSNSEKASARGRIKSRHIDFVIANPENLRILLAIELDDNSHKFKKIQEVDNFKNDVFEAVGLPYIRTYGNDDIEKLILEKISP